MIAQAAGMDSRRDEAMPQRVHLDQRRERGGIAEIVGVSSSRHRRAGRGLDADDGERRVIQLLGKERQHKPAEVASSPHAADEVVGPLSRP